MMAEIMGFPKNLPFSQCQNLLLMGWSEAMDTTDNWLFWLKGQPANVVVGFKAPRRN